MDKTSNWPLNHSPNKPIVTHLACEGMLANPKGIVGLLVLDRRVWSERPVKKRRADEEKKMKRRWRKDVDGPKVAPACRARLCSSLFPVNALSSFHRYIYICPHKCRYYTKRRNHPRKMGRRRSRRLAGIFLR